MHYLLMLKSAGADELLKLWYQLWDFENWVNVCKFWSPSASLNWEGWRGEMEGRRNRKGKRKWWRDGENGRKDEGDVEVGGKEVRSESLILRSEHVDFVSFVNISFIGSFTFLFFFSLVLVSSPFFFSFLLLLPSSLSPFSGFSITSYLFFSLSSLPFFHRILFRFFLSTHVSLPMFLYFVPISLFLTERKTCFESLCFYLFRRSFCNHSGALYHGTFWFTGQSDAGKKILCYTVSFFRGFPWTENSVCWPLPPTMHRDWGTWRSGSP